MSDLAERLDQIVGGFAVIFDDQKAHFGNGGDHGSISI
jgi:hypothetical protein